MDMFDFNPESILTAADRPAVGFANGTVQAAVTERRVFTSGEISELMSAVKNLSEAEQTSLLESVKNRGITDTQEVAGVIHEALRQRSDLNNDRKIDLSRELTSLESSTRQVTDQEVANADPAIRREVQNIKAEKDKIAEGEAQLASLFMPPVSALASATIETADARHPDTQDRRVAALTEQQLREEAWRRNQPTPVLGHPVPLAPAVMAASEPLVSAETAATMRAVLAPQIQLCSPLPCQDMGPTGQAIANQERGFVSNAPALQRGGRELAV